MRVMGSYHQMAIPVLLPGLEQAAPPGRVHETALLNPKAKLSLACRAKVSSACRKQHSRAVLEPHAHGG